MRPAPKPAVMQRLPLIDLLKAVASQLIVLHHLAFYGPMSDVVAQAAPQLIEWLARHGRLAVQVFLVVGGFLAARQLAPEGRLVLVGSKLAALRERYLRLALPYAATLLVVLVCAALARRLMTHPSIPEPAGWWPLLAHLLLLQDLLGVDALSAGVWYVAIDFQLFALLVGLLWLAVPLERRLGLRQPLAPWLVTALWLASLLHFNRQGAWDVAAPYFFGAYGLGAMAAWWASAPMRPRWRVASAAGAGAVVASALLLDWRPRIALAAVVALAIMAAARWRFDLPGWAKGVVGRLSRISYCLFLVHFGVCLVINAAFVRFLPATAAVQGLGMLLAWGASLGAAALMHRWVEVPAVHWVAARGTRAVASARAAVVL